MTTSEKIAYLKGLAEGVGMNKDSKDNKLFSAIIDVLDSLASDVEDLEETTFDLGEEIDAVSDDLAAVEEVVFDECDDDICHHDYDDDCYCHDQDDDCCCHDHDEDEFLYEVTCPACENTITIDEGVLNMGSIECPNCGELLEFDLDATFDDFPQELSEDESPFDSEDEASPEDE